MGEEPPETLVDLVQRLHVATAAQVRGVAGRARRLARGLPLFESVWVDALAQARVLTPFQASEINAGRGDALRVGPYLVRQQVASPAYVVCYVGQEIATGRLVRLAVGPSVAVHGDCPDFRGESRENGTVPFGPLAELLENHVSASERLGAETLAPIMAAGIDAGRMWAACRHVVGLAVAEWMVHNGRFAPQCVLEIARQMLAGLAELERAGLCHSGLDPASVVLTGDGGVVLPFPGLRGLLRPEEGFAHADLRPEAYDYLAPERVTRGSPADIPSDLYACGCLWWHLLTGRVPVPGGDALAKLRAGQTVRIADVSHLAPETPEPLAAAISSCTARDPELRPESVARLARLLGRSTARGRALLAESVVHPGTRPARWTVSMRVARRSGRSPVGLAAIGACLVAGLSLGWSIWRTGLPGLAASAPAERREATSRGPLAEKRSPGPDIAEANHAPVNQEETRPATPFAATGRHITTTGPAGTSTASDSPPDPISPAANTLLLPHGKPVAAGSLGLRAGLTVAGQPGARALVAVPATGLVIRPEDVRFENVDFVGEPAGASSQPASAAPALIELQASHAEFRACSFQWAGSAASTPVAVRWTHPVQRREVEMALPSGRVQFSDCVFRNVGAALTCRTVGAVAVEAANVLHLGPGPLVQLDHWPRLDEPTAIAISQVTLRGSGPVLECLCEEIGDHPGRLSIQSEGCALLLPRHAALLSFVGPRSPESLLRNVQWSGQGSLVSPEALIARWVQPGGEPVPLNDDAVSMAGLVRSEVAFAGPAEADPAASRVVRWQAPLQSANPPGIDPRNLWWPRH